MQRVLVTGGTGFLGRHTVRALVASERAVRVLARHHDAAVADDGAEIITGSVLDRAAVEAALEGCDAVVHLAGRVSRDPADADALRQLHVEGTVTVLEAAARVGVPRVVLCSSSGTIAASRSPHHLPDETAPWADEVVGRWPYYASKIAAEQRAVELAARLGLDLVRVNPSLLLGPGDVRGSSTGDVYAIVARRLPAIPPGGLNFVDVRDAAVAVANAVEAGVPGERYLIGAHNWTLERFVRFTALLAGVRPPRLRLPAGVGPLATRGLRAVLRPLGRSPAVDAGSAEMAEVFWYFDAAKARRVLGLTPREADETLRATIEWVRRSPPTA